MNAVRVDSQVDAIRDAFGSESPVHLTAPDDELSRRYSNRPDRIRELASYGDVQINATERNVETAPTASQTSSLTHIRSTRA